ncbi:MAG: thermonuclease family protein [Anaerolineae bacterium]|nr:thermonuclease family protein [Anaerolineae bacterium]
MRRMLTLALLSLPMIACAVGFTPPTPGALYTEQPPGANGDGEQAVVTSVIDGDTIDVRIGASTYRVRYIGINTPELDEPCYREATDANAAFVSGKTVTLVKDESNTDRYGRLLRYIYVDNIFVNEQLILQGYAEVVVYPPDTRYADYFTRLEQEAAQFERGCHPTGIFDDGSYTR